ncbi:MAG TPA: DUF2863 family protein [Burkholderiaceae bacterium]|nr:DUF2863 family protein [bacterium SGD-2]HZH57849.1 DUF2863 family protein [Burkholderiaceae bacterium]
MSDSPAIRLTRDAKRLITLGQALARSGSRLEDIFWEDELARLIAKILGGKKSRTLEDVLDFLVHDDIGVYEILVEQAETCSESVRLTHQGIEYDVLLVSAPIVAWTRYRLPQGRLTPAQHEALRAALAEIIAAEGAQIAMLPHLVSFDEMPQTFQETRVWTQRLGALAIGASSESCPTRDPADNEGMLADARFAIAAIAVPAGQPVFRWQDPDSAALELRKKAEEAWAAQITQLLGTLFTGCQTQALLPDAYYTTNREADRRIRPMALRAAVTWLQTAADLPGPELRAAIVACGNAGVEEFRIGFSPRMSNDVIYGCVWPVLSKEEAVIDGAESNHIDVPESIAALLKELGVAEIRRLPGIQPPEYCEDCGAPFFPNALGEMMHPELPDETDLEPVHFH